MGFKVFLQFQNLFEEIGRWRGTNIFRRPRFQLDEILRATDRIFECAIGGIEQCGIAETDGLFGRGLLLKKIGMKGAAEFIKLVFERREINVEQARKAE